MSATQTHASPESLIARELGLGVELARNQNGLSPSLCGADAAELDAVVQDFANGMEQTVSGNAFSRVPTELRARVIQLGDDENAMEVRKFAIEASGLTHAALAPIARANGWTVDRASNAHYELVEVPGAQKTVKDIDWDR